MSRPSRAWLARCALVFLCAWAACDETFDGPPEIVPAKLTVSLDTLLPLADGDAIDLQPPIQGGWVLFVGALLRNVSVPGGSLLGELRRSRAPDGTALSAPGGILYSDERSIAVDALPAGMAAPTAAAGWKLSRPDPNDTANIPTCPNPLDVDIVDNALFLQLTFRDRLGRTATAARRLTPRCTQSDPQAQQRCTCECSANFQAGKCVVH